MRRALIGLVASLLLLPACTKDLEPQQELARYLAASEKEPRSFLYEASPKTTFRKEVDPNSEVFVTGKVEDDLRVSAKLRLGQAEVLEQVISEDALAVHVIDASKIKGIEAGPVGGSMIVGDTLRSGRWVLDYAGAPPLVAERTREGSIKVGERPVLDAIYIFQYLQRAINEAATVILLNKDDVNYRPQDDPFPLPKEDAGELRYDLVAPPLPARSARGTAAGLPGAAHFRKMAFYVRKGKVVEVKEEVEFETHRDFRRAKEGRGPKYPLQLLDAVRAGKGREPIVVRTMSYRMSSIGDKAIKVTMPSDFLAANLAGTFGPQGLTSLKPVEEVVTPGEPTEPTATQTAGDSPSPGA